jgi:biopolymer transport protein ExbD
MNFVMFVFLVVLAFLLTPGILVSLPPGGSKKVVALTHAVVLALVYGLTHKLVYSQFGTK